MCYTSLMKQFALLAGFVIVLAGCSSAQERQDNALDLFKKVESTASGAVNQLDDVLQKGKTVTEGVSSMVQDAKRRFGQVESGVNLMMRGKEMIEGGMKGN